MKITEQDIINKYLKKLTFNNKKSLKLNDDVYYDSQKKLIFSTDTYEEGTHFLDASLPEKFVKKIFRSSISDIFAKGVSPTTYFLSLSIPKISKKWIKKFETELKKESKKYGLFLGGGDMIKSKKLTITISVIGHVNKKPILRNTAKINDDIYITGNIGDSYIGLLIKQKRLNLNKLNSYFTKAFSEPCIQNKFSKYLSFFASSSIDISDGLIKDLQSICTASECGAHIDLSKLPLSIYMRKVINKNVIKIKNVFSKGDDYQILFTANKKYRNTIVRTSKKTNTKITRVGVVNTGNFIKMTNGDKLVDLSAIKPGYIHRF
mgnify:CR=1 FL=1|tara:strand:- start:267 stop:1226 length:960 start_codon:yes stop_codon:yes gene_type:complete